MNNHKQNTNIETSCKFFAPGKRFFVISEPGVTAVLFLWLFFCLLLFTPGLLYAQVEIDKSRVRDIQLLLSLKGYDLSYGDSKGVDGKLGSTTREAIIDYQKKKNLPLTGGINKRLYDSLYEDIKSKPQLSNGADESSDEQKTGGDEKANPLFKELEIIRGDLKNINAELGVLKAFKESIPDKLINNYTSAINIFIAIIGILVGLFGLWLGWYVPIFRKKVTEDVENAHREMGKYSSNYIYAGLLTEFSHHCLALYKDFDTESERQKILHDSYLDIAKRISDRGYKKAKLISERKVKLNERDNAIIHWSINNKLFYMVTPFVSDDKINQNDELDKQEVRKVYEEMQKIYATYDEKYMEKNWWNLKETLIWARFNMKYYEDISEIKEIVQYLISNRYFPYEWRLDVFNRYNKHRTIFGDKLDSLAPPIKTSHS